MDAVKYFKSCCNPWIYFNLVLVCFVIRTSVSQGMLQNQYVGCFYDDNTQLKSETIRPEQLTIQSCIATCHRKNTPTFSTYAKIQNGTVCHCGNEYGIQLSDDACNVTCSGNQLEYCGKSVGDRLSAYSLYTVCPIGYHGQSCDKVCHCKGQIPCDRATGDCPDGCDGNYTGLSCTTAPISKQYIGCYGDNNENRTFTVRRNPGSRNTLEFCAKECANLSHTYAGPQFGGECHCGDTSYDKHGKLNEDSCNSECGGNKSQKCGGANALSIYRVCPMGNFGKECTEKCNCRDGWCKFNGGCSPCKPGWNGTSCNLRDCSTNNGQCNEREVCLNINLNYANVSMCRCQQGFHKTKIWETCSDKNECLESPSICGPYGINCSNTEGGYFCFCRNGKTLETTTCTSDINECVETPSICGPDSVGCNNTEGSYLCVCRNGETVENGTCIAIQTGSKQESSIATLSAIIISVAVVFVLVLFMVLYIRSRRKKDDSTALVGEKCDVKHKDSSEKSPSSYAGGAANAHDQCDIYYATTFVKQKEINIMQLTESIRSKLSSPGTLDTEFKQVPMETKEPSAFGKHRDAKKKKVPTATLR